MGEDRVECSVFACIVAHVHPLRFYTICLAHSSMLYVDVVCTISGNSVLLWFASCSSCITYCGCINGCGFNCVLRLFCASSFCWLCITVARFVCLHDCFAFGVWCGRNADGAYTSGYSSIVLPFREVFFCKFAT